MIRRALIEQIRRKIYNGPVPNDATITENLVNQLLNQAIGVAAVNNYNGSLKMEGVAYINNSYYTTFKNIAISADENFTYKIQLPSIPYSIGKNEGVSTVQVRDPSDSKLSIPCIPLTANQRGYFQTMRQPPNKVYYWSEGLFIYLFTAILLISFTASIVMVSGGDSTSLDNVLNVPDDAIPFLIEYCTKELLTEHSQKKDLQNDGVDQV